MIAVLAAKKYMSINAFKKFAVRLCNENEPRGQGYLNFLQSDTSSERKKTIQEPPPQHRHAVKSFYALLKY